MIQLLGPGAAGKTTVGSALAARLEVSFADLDAEFMARHGDISAFIGTRGYEAYATQNVRTYLSLLADSVSSGVMALSSGFMTYRDNVHPEYPVIRQRLGSDELAFVLLPSLDLEICVSEIVCRQLRRPFARSPGQEERVIRSRFPVYANLPARKVTTLRSVCAVVDEIMGLLPCGQVSY